MDFNKCKKIISGKTMAFSGKQCVNSVWEDGFCKMHHPKTIVARRDKFFKSRIERPFK